MGGIGGRIGIHPPIGAEASGFAGARRTVRKALTGEGKEGLIYVYV
jgi:hypothetical protein